MKTIERKVFYLLALCVALLSPFYSSVTTFTCFASSALPSVSNQKVSNEHSSKTEDDKTANHNTPRFVVALDGTGDFTSVQDAINAAPDYCKQSGTTIFIKKGVYKEKLTIPKNKQKLYFLGEDAESTIITWNDYALKHGSTGFEMGTSATSTIFLYADDCLFENLTIENSSGSGKHIAQACAITVDGDRVAFVNCKFIANQDTIYTYSGGLKQYYKNCWIEGTTDFIFGASICYFDSCTILSKLNSYVTAASTPKGQKYGYVFNNCKLIHSDGVDKVYLGRPWRPYAKTVFINCELGDHIRPEGWHNWNKKYAEKTCFYAEYGSYGPGAYTKKDRVRWSHQIKKSKLKDYTIDKVLMPHSEIDKNGVYVKVDWYYKDLLW